MMTVTTIEITIEVVSGNQLGRAPQAASARSSVQRQGPLAVDGVALNERHATTPVSSTAAAITIATIVSGEAKGHPSGVVRPMEWRG